MLLVFQELQIDFSQYDHPVVLTVEAQVKTLRKGGGKKKKFPFSFFFYCDECLDNLRQEYDFSIRRNMLDIWEVE